ncbi:hypothetical protein HanIR_Chr17g0858441 [Helianthus annuus]|nr:hypothetical protein HanIR_Chr17g0858441 [Helianthus annuus]
MSVSRIYSYSYIHIRHVQVGLHPNISFTAHRSLLYNSTNWVGFRACFDSHVIIITITYNRINSLLRVVTYSNEPFRTDTKWSLQ